MFVTPKIIAGFFARVLLLIVVFALRPVEGM